MVTQNDTNFTWDSPPCLEMSTDVILYGILSYSIIFLIGSLGNIMVLYVLMKEKSLRNFTNYLLANLSVADLLVLFTCVPAGLHDLFAKERWYLGKMMCYLIAFIENCMGFASILSIFFITCDRFYVICKPLSVKSVMTQTRTMKLIALIWIVSILVNMPFIFLSEYSLSFFSDNQKFEHRCDTKSRHSWSFYYILAVTFVYYLIIGLVLLIMYYMITRSLNKSNQFIALSVKNSNIDKPTNRIDNSLLMESLKKDTNDMEFKARSASGSGSGQYNISLLRKSTIVEQLNSAAAAAAAPNQDSSIERHIKQRRQIVVMLMCVIMAFYLCLFPLKTWNLVLMIGSRIDGFFQKLQYNHYWIINITTRFFFYMNSSINPILYNYFSSKFRKSFKKIFMFKYI